MQHIGKETFVEVNNSRYKLSRYTRELDGEFTKWALEQLPDPIEQARTQIRGFPPEVQQVIIKDALEQKRKRDAGVSDEVLLMKNSDKGMWKILCLLFQKYNPELTERDVANIFDECLQQHGKDYLADRISEAQGIVKQSDLPQEGLKKTHHKESPYIPG
jgi:hypothetical protein